MLLLIRTIILDYRDIFFKVNKKLNDCYYFSKFYVIDQPGSLYLLETDMANNISIGQALRKDVWSALWATDNPQMLAVAEKARLYVMRDTEPEEPLTMQGYLCKFKVSRAKKVSYRNIVQFNYLLEILSVY